MPLRCINVINFLRGVEPRCDIDLFEPLQRQMALSLDLDLPTTWLLQFDALVSGPFVSFLKESMPGSHEVGGWFEMNQPLCEAADLAWRGRPGFSWDHYPDVAFTIGYSPEERVRLADAFMSEFRGVWGLYPSSIACWNLDALTLAHFADHYSVEAFAVCRDQIATDGYTIWGAPIAGWYPSRSNAYSPAVELANQIDAPIFRMLGQDPTYYYQSEYPLPDGKFHNAPDTMEPVWPSGRSEEFVKRFLEMIQDSPCLGFAYAQLGQENSFGWLEMAEAYPKQMTALAELRSEGKVAVETLSETGRRFKSAFAATPPQAQVMLKDSFGNLEPMERTVWFQNKNYRANLHFKGSRFYLRDIHVYRDAFPQPFLNERSQAKDIEQRMLAVLDGWHWSPKPGAGEPGAAGWFLAGGEKLTLQGEPQVSEVGSTLRVLVELESGCSFHMEFLDEGIQCSLIANPNPELSLSFEWDQAKSSFESTDGRIVRFKWLDFDYHIEVSERAEKTAGGWRTTAESGRLKISFPPQR